QGNLQPSYPKSLAVFFGAAGLGGNGQIFYDWVANRFVIGQLISGNDGGVLYLAASASSDPTGAWHIYRLPVGGTGLLADYLQLGHNNRRDPFGGDIAVSFVLNNGGAGSQILFLPKAKVYAGVGFGYNFVFNLSINGVLSNFVVPARSHRLMTS